MDKQLIQEAFKETLSRYPESMRGLIFFKNALRLNAGEITDDVLKWANSVIEKV
jgi:hypothetical protein